MGNRDKGGERDSLLEYIRKINEEWLLMRLDEQMKVSLSLLQRLSVIRSFYDKIEGQRYKLN